MLEMCKNDFNNNVLSHIEKCNKKLNYERENEKICQNIQKIKVKDNPSLIILNQKNQILKKRNNRKVKTS